MHGDVAPFTSHSKVCNNAEPKPTHFFIEIYCAGSHTEHPGDALKDELILYCRPFPVYNFFDLEMKFPPCTREPAIWGAPCGGCFAKWNTHPQVLSNNCKTSFIGPQPHKIFLNIRDGEFFPLLLPYIHRMDVFIWMQKASIYMNTCFLFYTILYWNVIKLHALTWLI